MNDCNILDLTPLSAPMNDCNILDLTPLSAPKEIREA